jgi:hypothetical protein
MPRTRLPLAPALILSCLCLPIAARAADVPMFGKVMLARDGKLFKLVARRDPVTQTPYPIPGALPTGATAELTAFVHNGSGGAVTDPLTAGTWTALGSGPSGYKYKNAAAPSGGPVKLVLVKANVVKVLAKHDGTLLPGPIAGDVAVHLTVGPDTYCASSAGGTELRNDATVWKSKDNPTPVACPPVPACLPTTGCCNGAAFLSVTSANAPGDCGDIVNQSGVVSANLACGGLYIGGGSNSVPLPITMPDMAQSVIAISSCSGQLATLVPAGSAQTGSNRNCTDVGCPFGTPIPVPNTVTPPSSACVVNVVSGTASGTADCATGEVSLNLPLEAVLYFTGDTETDPSNTIPGIQPCPLCSGGSCIGGPNDGLPCAPGNSPATDAYPTSLDCPPDPMFIQGTLPIGFALTTGTATWTATPATNHDAVFASQQRVFSGYCFDGDDTGSFANPPQQCWENGMAVGPPCSGLYEECGQGTQGAFGPGGAGVRTITAIGTSAGPDLHCGAAGTLVSLFSLAHVSNATIDNAASLPGPAAVAIPVSMALCAAGDPCP